MDNTGVDMLLGIGGSPEAVVTACALKCLGGDIQCRLWPRDAAERESAQAKGVGANDLTIVILDRPRHADLIEQVRRTGARIKFISDGDVAGGIMPCMDDTGVDMLLGIGGSPEAVVTACALKCLGGDIQCRLWPRDDAERAKAEATDQPLGKVLTMDDLVRGDDVFMSLTGITHGELVDGVRYTANGALPETLAMRSRSGPIRRVLSRHNIEKLSPYAAVAYE